MSLPERRCALTGSVSESDVDLSNWAGNLTGRFIKVLTQKLIPLRACSPVLSRTAQTRYGDGPALAFGRIGELPPGAPVLSLDAAWRGKKYVASSGSQC